MSTPTDERCHTCDMPLATREQRESVGPICGHGKDVDGPCAECDSLCWATRLWCRNPAVDWRARCLKAESALALLSTPLSPEALQAIAEESAE